MVIQYQNGSMINTLNQSIKYYSMQINNIKKLEISDFDWIPNGWKVVFANIYDIDLLETEIFSKMKYSENFKEEISFDYFTEDMLYIKNNLSSIAIDVSSYSKDPRYQLTLINNALPDSFDHPLEKITFYRFSDLKKVLIEMMNKYC